MQEMAKMGEALRKCNEEETTFAFASRMGLWFAAHLAGVSSVVALAPETTAFAAVCGLALSGAAREYVSTSRDKLEDVIDKYWYQADNREKPSSPEDELTRLREDNNEQVENLKNIKKLLAANVLSVLIPACITINKLAPVIKSHSILSGVMLATAFGVATSGIGRVCKGIKCILSIRKGMKKNQESQKEVIARINLQREHSNELEQQREIKRHSSRTITRAQVDKMRAKRDNKRQTTHLLNSQTK